jgi:hypothetical protein
MMPAMLHDGKTDAETVERAVDASLEVLSLSLSLSLALSLSFSLSLYELVGVEDR